MVAQDPLWQYLIIFGLGGLSALLVVRLVYGTSKITDQNIAPQEHSLPSKNSVFVIPVDKPLEFSSRQTLLPKELRLWYRRLHLALGVDHVIVPRVKLSRLVAIKNTQNPNSEILKTIRTTGVDFAVCSSNTLKVLAVVRLTDNNGVDKISDLLKQVAIPEVQLLTSKEYSTSELRGIFMTKLLPPTARTLPIAV